MSSRSVQIIGGPNRDPADVDRWNDALIAMDEVHANIHRGIFFTGSHVESIAGDGIAEFLIRVTASAHMRFTGTVAHQMQAQFFEGPTTSADGTPITTPNRNRFSSTTATTLVFAGPTVSVDGTKLIDFFIPGGNKQTAAGGQGNTFEEWILNPGDYLVRISNDIINPAAAGYAGVMMEFYEPTDTEVA